MLNERGKVVKWYVDLPAKCGMVPDEEKAMELELWCLINKGSSTAAQATVCVPFSCVIFNLAIVNK